MKKTKAKKRPARKTVPKKKTSKASSKRVRSGAPGGATSSGSVPTRKLQFITRAKRNQWVKLRKRCLELEFGKSELVKVPVGLEPRILRSRIYSAIQRTLSEERPDATFQIRLTKDLKFVGVSCEEA